MPRITPRLAALPLAAMLAASSAGAALAQEPVTVTDAQGSAVLITDASRIVTLGGAVTEIAYALGAADRIVAVDEGSFHPAAALAENPVVGYHRFLAAEPVVAAAPTLVLGAAETGPPEVLDQLRNAGITLLLIPDAVSVDEASDAIELVGAALAGVEAAHNDRRWAHRVWPQHAEVDRLGYELLAQCWTDADVGRLNDIDLWQRKHEIVAGKFDSSTLG